MFRPDFGTEGIVQSHREILLGELFFVRVSQVVLGLPHPKLVLDFLQRPINRSIGDQIGFGEVKTRLILLAVPDIAESQIGTATSVVAGNGQPLKVRFQQFRVRQDLAVLVGDFGEVLED